MGDAITRIALLARPGQACERLGAALRDAGADVVMVADPTEAQADAVVASGAQAVLIALEPSIEDALDRFDSLLADPDITVIFEEADLAMQREGWDAARWMRHLAAKLGRRDDVLPPGTEPESDVAIEPGRLSLYQRPESHADVAAFADEAQSLAPEVPRDAGLDPVSGGLRSLHEAPDRAGFQEDDSETTGRFHRDLDDLHLRIADMQLENAPRAVSGHEHGVVMILAGLGGPDAVRQLLAGLPSGFVRPVLVLQRLDGARHDKLVRQMQRATAMPVELAEPGATPQPGRVYVLPSGLGLVADAGGLVFGDDGGDVFAALPPADSAIVMLSGSDPALVDEAMHQSWNGAVVVAQSPDGCYDTAATDALIARGAEAGSPAELAGRLAVRWPS